MCSRVNRRQKHKKERNRGLSEQIILLKNANPQIISTFAHQSTNPILKTTVNPIVSTPNFLFIDVILLSYRLGRIRCNEQKVALLAATRAASDAMTFMTAIESFGITRNSDLHRFVGQLLAAPEHYRSLYPRVLGLRHADEQAEGFLNNLYVLFLTEGILTFPQQELFTKCYWWFTNNHNNTVYDAKKGLKIGIYATEPQDNESTLIRFEEYLNNLIHHKSQQVRKRFEGFPADMVIAILRRAFL